MDMHSLDVQLLLVVNQAAANTLFDILMPALSQLGYLLVLPFLAGMMVWSTQRQDRSGRVFLPLALGTLLVAITAVVIAEWMEGVLKAAVARPRPCRVIEGIRLIVACPRSYSMPSGHAITSFACAMPLYLLTRGYVTPVWRLYPLLLAAAIALSRLYLGVHYPSDVLAGVLLGALIGSALSFLLLWIRTAGTPRRERQ
jgi:undecaprenyl-diphosphatase